MKNISETGHNKNIVNFERLISFCKTIENKYQPSKADLALTELDKLYAQSKEKIEKSIIAKQEHFLIIGEFQTLFQPLKKLATQLISALEASGATMSEIQQAKSINLKIQGKRANNKPKDTKTVDGKIVEKKIISVSRQSKDSMLEHFAKLLELLRETKSYQPKESFLQISTLEAQLQDLNQKNSLSIQKKIDYQQSLITRNQSLYNPETGLVKIAQQVKKYLKSIFGTENPNYQQINSLQFTHNS
jgi:hypothetical protein